jgi:hypothetical protein
LSGDTVTNAVCILYIAILYRKMYLKEELKIIDKILKLFFEFFEQNLIEGKRAK